MSRCFRLFAALLPAVPASAQVLNLTPAADGSIYINNASPTEQLSNGAGSGIYCGRTFIHADIISRGLIRFDVSAVPPGATITSVSLTLELAMSSPAGNPRPVGLHRVLASWGEGTSVSIGGLGWPSTAGDSSWRYRVFPATQWANPGGDYASAASATLMVPDVPGTVTWASTAALIADVAAWVNDGASNFGWLMHNDESVNGTAARFSSREATTGRPILRIEYQSCYPNCDGSTLPPTLNVQDFSCFLNKFAGGDSYANCDGSTILPVLNVQDFGCFLNAFAAGCS